MSGGPEPAWAQARAAGSPAVVVVQRGAIVAEWGETQRNLLLNSARKSLLSALMGIAAAARRIRLDDTRVRLGVDGRRRG